MSGMSKSVRAAGLGAATLLIAAGALGGCGRVGELQQPAPLYGARARAEYQQRQADARRRAAEQGARTGSAERTDQDPPGPDNAPRTTREVRDPNQQNIPASRAPIPGSVNDPFGPQPSLTPPGR
jgi:hypothetical protein